MKLKSRIRIIAINLVLFGLLFGLVSFNKEFLRPNFNYIPIVQFLTGSFPNFIVALLISLAFVNGALMGKPKFDRQIVYIGSILVFIILTVEELKPMWGASTYCDIYDIIGSGTGALLAILTFEFIVSKRKNIENRPPAD